MRILMLNYEFPPLGGGAGNATYYLLKEFSKHPDLEIDLVTSSIAVFKIQKFSENIVIHFLDINKKGNLHYQANRDLLKYSCKAYFYCKKLIKEKQFDLCHAFFGIPCGYVAMKLGLPYIVSLRGSDVPFYNKRFYWLDKFIFKNLNKKIWEKAEKVIANSEGLKNLANKTNPRQQIEVVYNGVDTEEFKPIENKSMGEKIKLISTGRLIERKGYEYLIESLEGLNNFELTLIGDGNLRIKLEELAHANKVKVNFLGKIDHKDIVSHLQKADIFVLPSLNEGMSNSILEAMACGLPIIATDTGGSKELIQDNGFIVSKVDADALRDVIERLLGHQEFVKSMGQKSRELAKRMSWVNTSAQYYNYYKKICVG